MKNKLWKLAKMMMNFKEYETEQGKLVVNGEIEVGTEVAVENENGELQPAEGEYIIDGLKVTVEAGKITEVEKPEEQPDEETTETSEENVEEKLEETTENTETSEETQPDEKDLKIQELEGLLADAETAIKELTTKVQELEGLLSDKEAAVEELTAQIKELEEKINKPVEEPVKMAATVKEITRPQSGALKYFQEK